MRDRLGSLLTRGEGRAGTSPAPGQDRLQKVQRNTSQDGQDEPSRSSEKDSEEGKVGQVRAGRCGGPRGCGMEMKGLQGNVIK